MLWHCEMLHAGAVSAMKSQSCTDREEEKGRLTGHDKKRGGQRRKEWCKGEKGEVTSKPASSFEHPKKGNARTPVDLR